MRDRVLVLAPHPDDAELYAGGTIAKLVDEGATALIVVATDGSKGSFEIDAQNLARVRNAEAVQGGVILGAEVVMLGHVDLALERLAPGALREQFIRTIRRFRPDLLIAQDPMVHDTHPDHRAVAWAAAEAVRFANLPLMHPEQVAEGMAPHFVLEKYFYRTDSVPAAHSVDISRTIERKMRALRAHGTQMVFLVEDVVRQGALLGLDLRAALQAPEAGGDPAAAIEWLVRRDAEAAGRAAGYEYAESFRYERCDAGLESWLQEQQTRDLQRPTFENIVACVAPHCPCRGPVQCPHLASAGP